MCVAIATSETLWCNGELKIILLADFVFKAFSFVYLFKGRLKALYTLVT